MASFMLIGQMALLILIILMIMIWLKLVSHKIVHYDDADCNGYYLADDLENELRILSKCEDE